MTAFLVALAVLVGGYFVYGTLVEKVFGIDPKRLTPAHTSNDGVDYVPMPAWRVFLIQFLNIAGLGPIFGALQGALWGPVVFLPSYGLSSERYSPAASTTLFRQ